MANSLKYDLNATSISNPLISVPLITSTLLTSFLFFIDEGYYSFAWVLEPGAWLVFAIYIFIFFSVQVFLFGFFYNVLPNLFKGNLVLPSLSIISFIGLIFAGLILYVLFKTT
jgi:hypothetical protein